MLHQGRYLGHTGQDPRATGSVKTLQNQHGGLGARRPAPNAVPVSSRGLECVCRHSGTALGLLASCVSRPGGRHPCGRGPWPQVPCVSAGPGRG